MNKLILILLGAVLIICTISVSLAFANDPIPPFLPGNPDQAPIDGGLALLAAAGGGYAIKKLRDRKK